MYHFVRYSVKSKKWIIFNFILSYTNSLTSFTLPLRVFWVYASLRNAQFVRKERASYLRFFTQEFKIRKFMISCCVELVVLHQAINYILQINPIQLNLPTNLPYRFCNSRQFCIFDSNKSKPFTTLPISGATKKSWILMEGRLGLTHKRPNFRRFGTHRSPEFASVWRSASR